jgi:hypothetical protein
VVGSGRRRACKEPATLAGVELLDARLVTLPTKVIDGVLHYVYGRD